jgi:hypothetical protein
MAFTSPNMGLRIWDQTTDLYDHAQLADNFSKIDIQDHTPGRGVQIPTDGIADGAITSAKLAPGVIPTLSLADGIVTTAKLADHAVTPIKLGTAFPAVRLTHTASQTFTSGSWNSLLFNTESYDTDTMHSLVTNTERITFVTGGIYSIGANIAPTTGQYDTGLRVLKSGATTIAQTAKSALYWWYDLFGILPGYGQHLSFDYKFTAGDYIELQVRRRYGSITIGSAAEYSPVFTATWLGWG